MPYENKIPVGQYKKIINTKHTEVKYMVLKLLIIDYMLPPYLQLISSLQYSDCHLHLVFVFLSYNPSFFSKTNIP